MHKRRATIFMAICKSWYSLHTHWHSDCSRLLFYATDLNTRHRLLLASFNIHTHKHTLIMIITTITTTTFSYNNANATRRMPPPLPRSQSRQEFTTKQLVNPFEMAPPPSAVAAAPPANPFLENEEEDSSSTINDASDNETDEMAMPQQPASMLEPAGKKPKATIK